MAIGYSFGALVKTFVQLRDSLGEVAGFNKLALYNAMYPVGIIVMFNTTTNPNTAFPGTTWTQITDYGNLRAAGDQIGSTLGNDNITLTVANLPSHNHGWSGSVASTDLGTKATSGVGDHSHDFSGTVDNAGDHNHHMNFNTQDAGNHNHYIPGLVTTQDGNDRAISGGSVGQWVQNKVTSDAGNHSHHIDAYTENAGVHTHGYRGTTTGTGGHSHSTTLGSHAHGVSGTVGNTGSGTAINTAGRVHNVAAWVRTK